MTDSVAPDWAWAEEDFATAEVPRGRLHFYTVVVILFVYGAAAFFVEQLETGHYAFKLVPVLFIMSLVVSRANRLALLGFAVPLYFAIKTHARARADADFMIPMSSAFVIGAWFFAYVGDYFTQEGRTPKREAAIVKALLSIWLIWGVFGFVKATNIYRWFYQLSAMLALPAAFALVLRAPISRETVKRMLLGFTAAAFAFNFPFAMRTLLHYGPGALGKLTELREELSIVAGLGSESGLMLLVFAFSVGLSLSKADFRLRVVAVLFGVAPSAILILIYISRAALVTAAVVVAMAPVLAKKKIAAFATVTIIAGAVIAFILIRPEYVKSVSERFGEFRAGAAGRGRLRSEAMGFAARNPALGLGVGQYRFKSYGFSSAHNEFLNIAAEQGIFGGLLYLALIVLVGLRAWKVRKTAEPLHQGLISGATLAALAYGIYTQIQPLYFARAGLVMAGLAGLLYACGPESQEEYPSSEPEPDLSVADEGAG